MNNLLEGKIALVTGGANGIGRATAIAMARAGASVVVADIVPDGASETSREIAHNGGTAVPLECDVSSENAVEAMIQSVVKRFGRLDCAFNNAGIEGARVPMTEFLESEWDRVIDVNLKGTWTCMKHEIKHMLDRGSGSIVNTSSVAGLIGMKGSTAYGAAKHGIIGLTKVAAVEFADRGIRVNAVLPGAVRTPMTDRLMGNDPEREAMYMSIQPIGRFGTPDELAEVVVWLSSDSASLVTGIAMPVDGGILA